MKPFYVLLFFIAGFSIPLHAQYEYYDAKKIKAYAERNYADISDLELVDLATLLSKSRQVQINTANADSVIKKIIYSNEFLKGIFNIPDEDLLNAIGDTRGMSSSGFLGTLPSSPASAIASIGGIDVTNIANGVAMLMIDRAKQELTITFFNRFQEYAKNHPEFHVLFPKTTDNLSNLLAYKYPEMLPALRTGFFEDIDKLPLHLDDVLELPKYRDLLKHFPEIRVAVRSVQLIREIETGESNAAEVLNQFAAFKEWNEPGTSDAFFNFGNTVKLADIISQSLRYNPDLESKSNTDTSVYMDATGKTITATTLYSYINAQQHKVDSMTKARTTIKPDGSTSTENTVQINIADNRGNNADKQIWIAPAAIKSFIKNDTLFRIFLGLVTERVKSQDIAWKTKDTTISFGNLMNENAKHIFLFENKITEFISLASKIDKLTDSMKSKLGQGITLTEDDYYDYIDGSMDVLEYAFSFAQLFDSSLNINDYTLIARKANDLYRHIYKKEYTQALSNAVEILETAAKMIDSKEYNGLLEKIQANTHIDLGNAIKNDVLNAKEQQQLKAESDKRTSMQADIDKVLLIFNSQDKLRTLIDVLGSLNKYGLFMANMVDAQTPEEVQSVLDNAILPVGSSSIKKHAIFNVSIQSYLGAYCRIDNKNNSGVNAWNDRFGVTAPIGISASVGMNKGGAVSLFASLFDIGAIVDYQLQKDTVITSATQTGTAIQKDYSIKLEQIISPGFYLVYGFPWNIPLALGAGAQYGPGLGKIDIKSADLVQNNPSWRFNVFLAVDLPFFNLVNKTKGYDFSGH